MAKRRVNQRRVPTRSDRGHRAWEVLTLKCGIRHITILLALAALAALSTACNRPPSQPPKPPANVPEPADAGSGRAATSPASHRTADPSAYRWLVEKADSTIESIPPPPGFARITLAEGSWGDWLRGLPIEFREVRLHNGQPKANQQAHHAVIAIDVGTKNLQQCADAIIRLRAEYLLAADREDEVAFHFTSGDLAEWAAWRDGARPVVQGNEVTWKKTAERDASYACFRRYLDTVFTYAGTMSLASELQPVSDPLAVELGDLFIRAGSPGHAVVVVDVAANAAGDRAFLLAQSFMPAQEIHVLKNPGSKLSPWYPAKKVGELRTPEWAFRYENLRRFPAALAGRHMRDAR